MTNSPWKQQSNIGWSGADIYAQARCQSCSLHKDFPSTQLSYLQYSVEKLCQGKEYSCTCYNWKMQE